jgi:ankyrin repeat protein
MTTNRDEHGRTPLHLAIIDGNIEECKRLLQEGADVNAQDNDGNTPLILLMKQRRGMLN